MLSTILLVVGGFAFLVWSSYRSARRRAAEGDPWRPEGLRWSDRG